MSKEEFEKACELAQECIHHWENPTQKIVGEKAFNISAALLWAKAELERREERLTRAIGELRNAKGAINAMLNSEVIKQLPFACYSEAIDSARVSAASIEAFLAEVGE